MQSINIHAFQLWAVQLVVVLFLVAGLATLAVGVGLIVCSARTLRFFVAMNRWVPTRRVFRRWLAVVFVAGAVFSIFGLATEFDAGAVSFVFGLDARPSSVASWLVQSVRWVLIVGNLTAIAIGIMLGFFPDALAALEARGSRWYSGRQPVQDGDAMNLSLDNWVAAYPRVAGWIITVAALVLVGDFGIILSRIR